MSAVGPPAALSSSWSSRDSLLLLCRSHPHLLPPAAAACISQTCKDLAACFSHPSSYHGRGHGRGRHPILALCTLATPQVNPFGIAELKRPYAPAREQSRPTMPPGYGGQPRGPPLEPLQQQNWTGDMRGGDAMARNTHGTNRLVQLQLLMRSGAHMPPAHECNQVLQACAAAARWENVWHCYQELVTLGVPIDQETYKALWAAAFEACYVAQGVEIFRAMVSAAGSVCQSSYTSAISRLLKIRRRGLANKSLAYQLWKELEAAVGELDRASFRAGLNACIEVGRIQEAQELMTFMRQAKMYSGSAGPRCYNIMIKYHCRRGNMAEALKLVREMTKFQCPPDTFTFNTLVSGYSKLGDLDKAKAVIDKAKAEGCRTDVRTYAPYILAVARAGETAATLGAVQDMQAQGIQPNAYIYAAIVESHIKAADMPGAEAAAREMVQTAKLHPCGVIYNLLLQAYLDQGYAGDLRVAALLEEMKARGLALDVDTHCLLMNRSASSGEQQAERSVMLHMRQMRAQGLAPDAVQLSTVSKVLERVGRVHEALEVASDLQACPNSEKDMIAHNQLVHLLCVSGKMDEAERAAESAIAYASQHSLPPPVETFTALVKAYYRRRQLQPMLDAFRRFLRMGGKPNAKMANAVVRLCLMYGELSAAFKAIRAMQLLGVDMNMERYKDWVLQVQARQDGSASRGGSGGWAAPDARQQSAPPNQALERLKWFLGVSNTYYHSDWREG